MIKQLKVLSNDKEAVDLINSKIIENRKFRPMEVVANFTKFTLVLAFVKIVTVITKYGIFESIRISLNDYYFMTTVGFVIYLAVAINILVLNLSVNPKNKLKLFNQQELNILDDKLRKHGYAIVNHPEPMVVKFKTSGSR